MRIARGIVFAAVLVVLVQQASAGEIVNGFADLGNSGWSMSPSGAYTTPTDTFVTGWTGDLSKASDPFFTPSGSSGGYSILYQSGTGGLSAGNTLQLLGEYATGQGPTGDYGTVTLSLFGSSGLLAETTLNNLTTASGTWDKFSLDLLLPVGASSWKLELESWNRLGNHANVFWDNMTLDSVASAAVPVPQALSMGIILMLAGMMARRLRRRKLSH